METLILSNDDNSFKTTLKVQQLLPISPQISLVMTVLHENETCFLKHFFSVQFFGNSELSLLPI